MATLRQRVLSEMACAMALSPDKYRPVLVQTIETWFINGWANDKEMAYWKGLSHTGQLRFIRDCHLMMEFKVREWEETEIAIAKWKAEQEREAAVTAMVEGQAALEEEQGYEIEALEARFNADHPIASRHVRSYEREAIEEILADEAAENLCVILENARKIAEYDAWAATLDAQAALQAKATMLAVGDVRFVTQVINDDETIFLAIAYDFMRAEWEPRDGVVYYTTSGRCDSFVNTRFPEFAAPTCELAIANVLNWLNAVMSEPDAV